MTVKTGVDSQTLVNQINADIANAHTSVYSVNSQAQMLALTAQKGDIAVRTDTNYNYILSDLPASTLSNWVELKQDKDLLPSVPYSMHIAGGSTSVSSITLVGEPCYDVNAILVLVSHTIVPPSSYSLDATGTVLTFTSPVEAGLDIDLRWYSQLAVSPANQFANSDLSNLSTSGKHYVAFKGYDSTTAYSLNDVVVSIQNDEVKIYQSLADNNTSSLSDTTKWKEVSLGGGAGGEIGDMGFAPLGIDESLNLRRYLNGQVISQTQFEPFTRKVKSAVALFPSLATTEANWQAEKALSKFGQVGKFVIDDENQTIRLPAVVNAQGLLGLSGIGNLVNESLPNIYTEISTRKFQDNVGPIANVTGAGTFENNGYTASSHSYTTGIATSVYSLQKSTVDASLSSSTYQTNAPVQQEAIQYPYYIQVATGIQEELPAIREYKINTPFFFGQSRYFENAPYNASWLASNGQYNASTLYPDIWTQLTGVELNGSLNVGDTIEIGGKTYVKRGLPVVLSTGTITDYDFVVEQDNSQFRLPLLNGDRVLVAKKQPDSGDLGWYNLYSDGWLEQGICNLAINTGENVISFHKAFKDTFYTYTETTATGSGDYSVRNTVPVLNKKTTTSITVQSTPNFTNSFGFVVKGYAPIPTQADFTEVAGLYYYVGDTVQDASLINAGTVLGQLSNKADKTELLSKADVDASNFSSIGKQTINSMDYPNYSAGIEMAYPSSNTTVPGAGWLYLKGRNSNSTGSYIYINNALWSWEWNGSQYNFYRRIKVKSGDQIRIALGGGTTEFALTYYPFLGV